MLIIFSLASTASTPSIMLANRACCSLPCLTIVPIRSWSCSAMRFIDSASAPISSFCGTAILVLKSPRANRSAPCLRSSRGRLSFLKITKLIRVAKSVIITPLQIIRLLNADKAAFMVLAGTPLLTTPIILPLSLIGTATKIIFCCNVLENLVTTAVSPPNAIATSGRFL